VLICRSTSTPSLARPSFGDPRVPVQLEAPSDLEVEIESRLVNAAVWVPKRDRRCHFDLCSHRREQPSGLLLGLLPYDRRPVALPLVTTEGDGGRRHSSESTLRDSSGTHVACSKTKTPDSRGF